jgi:hypothetical protein
MTQSRTLPKAGQGPLSVIVPAMTGPVVKDNWPDGLDLLCRCGQILAQCVLIDQLWNVSIKCCSCGDVSSCDPLPRGTPLPADLVVLAYGEHPASNTEDLRGVVMVGEAAVAQRTAEVGESGSTFGRHSARQAYTLDAPVLQQLITKSKELLGANLEKLVSSDLRALASKTPSPNRHGLIRAISLLETAEQSFTTSAPFIDVSAWSELNALITLVDRWRGHPNFEMLRKGLVDEYEHTLILLAAATLLEDQGNGVVLQPANASGRSADLRLGTGAKEALAEIKAPRALIWPTAPITRQLAEQLVRKALNKARTGARGQLQQGKPGLLIVGGIHLNSVDLNMLERAADVHLARAAQQQIHKSLMGIVLIRIGADISKRFSAVGEVTTSLSRQFEIRVSRHPGYVGPAELRTTL